MNPEVIDVKMTEPQVEILTLDVPFPLFVGGYGSGKSEALIWNAITDVFTFQGAKVGIYAPTYDLLTLNLIPRFEEILDNELSVKYSHNKSRHIIYIHGQGQLIFRSADLANRIVAYECFRSHVDEADLLPPEKAKNVWERIIARNRQKVPKDIAQTLTVTNKVTAYSTPESFQFTYKRWQKEPGAGYKYVRAATYSNPFLPESYIDNLRDSYPPQLCEAYIEGKWVNIYSGNVYKYFDREQHHTDDVIEKNDTLYISQDFNVGGCVSIVYTIHDGIPMALDEFVSEDTEEIIQQTKSKYPDHKVIFYPDATGQHKDTRSSSSDIDMLKAAKFPVRVPRVNPFVKDRVNAMNRLLMKNMIRINTDRCKEFCSALEEQAWDLKTGMPQKYGEPASVDDYTDAGTYFIAYEYPVKKLKSSVSKLLGT